MKPGIVGFIVLLIGVLILALLMIFAMTAGLSPKGPNGQTVNPKQIQNQVNDLQNKMQQQQNQELNPTP